MASRSEAGVTGYRTVRDLYPILDGAGAERYGGRWNSPGRAVIYAGASFAIAVLERLAYLPTLRIPGNQVWAAITIPPGIPVEVLEDGDAPGWDAGDRLASRACGDGWHASRRSVALMVPSAVTRIDRNLLLNPEHPDFGRITLTAPRPVRWDARLFKARP